MDIFINTVFLFYSPVLFMKRCSRRTRAVGTYATNKMLQMLGRRNIAEELRN